MGQRFPKKSLHLGRELLQNIFLIYLSWNFSMENANFEGDSKQGLGTQNLKKCVKEGLCC